MDYKQLLELDGYINLWESLPGDKHSKISNLMKHLMMKALH